MVRGAQSSTAGTPLGPRAAACAFMSIAWLAVAAGAVVAGGAAGHLQLRLATASVEGLAGLQDICTSRTAKESSIHSH